MKDRTPTDRIIAFDADDTLWHNERLYSEAQDRFIELLSQYHNSEWVEERLYQMEMKNLAHFGYGIKAFALSMIETALELTEGRVTGNDIQTIIEQAKAMMAAEVELLPYVASTVEQVAARYPLMLLTKGDLLDQERKLARSGLAPFFKYVEIVSEKTEHMYSALMKKHDIDPKQFVMVGNSLRSDILPVLALGSPAVYVPHYLTWAHEAADPPPADQPGFYQIEHLGQLPDVLDKLNGSLS